MLDRPKFLQTVQTAPETIQRYLIALAVRCPHEPTQCISRAEFQEISFADPAFAGNWQYKVPDIEDVADENDAVLFPLLQTLRKFVQEV